MRNKIDYGIDLGTTNSNREWKTVSLQLKVGHIERHNSVLCSFNKRKTFGCDTAQCDEKRQCKSIEIFEGR